MKKWKKNFNKLPAKLVDKLATIEGENIKVVALKIFQPEPTFLEEYSHLSLTEDMLKVGNKFEIIPPVSSGKYSKRNQEGHEVVRKDLPKFTKYFYREIANFGDAARNGWSTVGIPREVYEREFYPPKLYKIEAEVKEVAQDGSYGVVFSIDEIFSKDSPSFDADLFFAINLIQENTGTCDVVEASIDNFVFSRELNWSVFPPGDLDGLALEISKTKRNDKSSSVDEIMERLRLFEQFKPQEYLQGLGGNDHYIGAKYAEDLVVFENLKYGNALYILYEDWEKISKLPRSELLRMSNKNFDRIRHVEGWKNVFSTLLSDRLKDRGIKVSYRASPRRRWR